MQIPKYLQVILTVFLLALAGYAGVLTWNAYASHDTIGRPPDVRDTITISGEGKITSQPDIARVEIGVISEGEDVASTQERNTEQANAIIASFKEFGISDEDVQTSNYQVFPQYDYDEGKQTLRGYRVSQSLSVKIRDLSKIGDVLAKAGELGSNEIHGVSFDIDDPSALEMQAREQAINDAKDKAEALADTLGVKVVRIVGFIEEGSGVPPATLLRAYAEDAAGMGVGGASPDVKPGSFDVTKTVSITFEIR
jgi:uncharacterized protein YggE